MTEKKVFSVFARGARAVLFAVCALAVVLTLVVTLGPKILAGDPQTQEASAPVETEAPVDPMTQFRTEREQLYAMQTAQLNEIIYGEKTDDETRAMAQRQLLTMLAQAEKQTTLEGILHARGFPDAVVTVAEDSVNVLLRADIVTSQEASVVLDLVLRETGVTGGNVKIIPIN